MTHLRPQSLPKLLFLVVLSLLVCASAAYAQPSFQKSFSPSTMGPGSISTLTFTITNASASPATSMAFVDSLPAGMTVADPALGSNSCAGSVSASTGDTSISLSGGSVGGSSSCTIEVNVTASGGGSYTNTTGDLTSSAGNSGTATANLTVDTNRPGFSKSFSPSPATFNGRVTLSFLIDNSASSQNRFNLSFTDNLPSGMTVASPANLSNTCGGVASASGSLVSLVAFGGDPSILSSGATCSVSVDVIAGSVGILENLSGELSSTPSGSPESSGKAGATLEVFANRLALTKTFTDDPVAPGDSVTLQFTLTNLDRRGPVTDITFTDDLDAALSGLVATSLPSNPCGSGSSITGSSVLTLADGNLDPEASCSFSVTLQVPASASPGAYVNTTSSILGDSSGTTVSGNPASDTLFVEASGVSLSMTFLDNPVGTGGSTTLQYTLSNDGASDASNISFTNEFPVELPTASAPLGSSFCNSTGSSSFIPSGFDPPRLIVSGVSLTAGSSCMFSITLDVDSGAGPGTYTSTVAEVTATIDGDAFSGDGASDDIVIVGGPLLTKEFLDDPALPGGTVTLQFSLEQRGGEGGPSATSIAFTDDLSAALSGLAASSLPAPGFCGGSSQITGTTTLAITGAELAAGETCDFSVVLDVPAAAAAGSYTNTTSSVTANVGGVATITDPASDDLLVAGVSMTKEFIDDPVLPGGTVTLRYTINNVGTSAATGIFVIDNYDNAVDNMAASTLPAAGSCGAGSSFSGTTQLTFVGGEVAAGGSCTFDVILDVPAGTADDTYLSTTTIFNATIGGSAVTLENASAFLEVTSSIIGLDKEFLDDPVAPGGMVTLRFTVTNLSDLDVTDLAFTDDLDAVISGMESASGTLTDPCGAGSSFDGTGLVELTGGMLGDGASCSFDIAVNVPAVVGEGPWINVTSEITGTALGLPVSGGEATDELEIASLELTKAFDTETAEPGDTVSLSFTITNDGGDTASDLSFVDDLDDMLSGLEADPSGLPLEDPCGEGSSFDGLDVLTLLGGTLPPNGSCTFAVDVVVPGFASPGVYVNVTEELRQGGFPVADPASDSLEIIEIVDIDTDGDGVLDQFDVCAGTAIPEGVPTIELKPNRYALVDGDFIFDTEPPPGGGQGPGDVFTTTDTGGCSCEQIIVALGLGQGHVKFGCAVGVMRNWVNLVMFGPVVMIEGFEDGLDGWTVVN